MPLWELLPLYCGVYTVYDPDSNSKESAEFTAKINKQTQIVSAYWGTRNYRLIDLL